MKIESICLRPLLKRGISLGVVTSIVASLLFWVVIIVREAAYRLYDKSSGSNDQVGLLGVAVILVVATIVVSLFPGIVGGASNAYVLYQLFTRGKLTKAISIASGLLVGFLAGLVTIFGVFLVSGSKVDASVVYMAFLVSCFSTPMGGWHGWRIGTWLLEAL